MDTKYEFVKRVGEGSFGIVCQAIDKVTGEVVAVKIVKRKYYSEDFLDLIEVTSLRKMNHSNIIKLREVIREENILYFVFEYMDSTLRQLMRSMEGRLSEEEIRNYCFQVFQGLTYMHRRGYFHRDLKPDNLLVSNDVIKIADLSLAREINPTVPYTVKVGTRCYRAPESLLWSTQYTSAVDMWAMGAIMVEMFTNRLLFPGKSELDQLNEICNVIGTPTETTWSDGLCLARKRKYKFPSRPGVSFSSVMPSASEEAVDLIKLLCSWDPMKRPTAAEVIQHPFFRNCFHVPRMIPIKIANDTKFGNVNKRIAVGPRKLGIVKGGRFYDCEKPVAV